MQAACGLTDKPTEQILNIDAADIDNELAVVEYVEDMYKFYKLVEVNFRFYKLQISLYLYSSSSSKICFFESVVQYVTYQYITYV